MVSVAFVLLVSLLSSAAATGSAAFGAVTARVSVGNAPAVPPSESLMGAAPVARPLSIDVVLQPRDPSALKDFATATSTPGNRLYRHFLRRGQFASVFGPTPGAISAVRSYLRKAGLSPGSISTDHLIITVHSTVGAVEKALGISMKLYRQPAGSSPSTAVVNTDAPMIPRSVATYVQGVIGLDTFTSPPTGPVPARRDPRKTPVAAPDTTGPKACSAATETASEYSAWTYPQLAKAYSFSGVYSKGDLGSGTTVALFEEQTFSKSDISAFQSCYGTKASVKVLSVDDGRTKDSDDSPEAALDIETVIGMAPEAKLLVYETVPGEPGPTDGYDAMVTQDKAQVISSSWSTPPFSCDVFVPSSVVSAENTIFEEAASQGQSTFVATGDVGSASCMANNGVHELTTGTTSSEVTAPDAVAVDPSSQTVYVANFDSGTVTVLDESTLSIVKSVSLGSSTEPDGIGVDPTTNQVWVSEYNAGVVAEIDGATCDGTTQSDCTPTDVIDTAGTKPNEIAIDATTGTAYVALSGSEAVAVISASKDKYLGESYAYEVPYGVAVDATTNDVYFTSLDDDLVGEFSGASCDASSVSGCPTSSDPPGEVGVGADPAGIAVDASRGLVYAVNFASDSVSVLDASTGATEATVDLDDYVDDPVNAALSPSGSGVLIAAEGDDGGAGVVVISSTTDAVTRLISSQGGVAPFAVASDPTDGYAWVADDGLGTSTDPGGLVWMPMMLSVEDPSDQPYVTAVGGTELKALGPAPTQSTWNEPLLAAGAGTGGISADFEMQSWQTGPGVISSLSSNVPCGAPSGSYCREVPDVSASADPVHGYVIYYDGEWSTVGGTSAATPLWAALTALIDVYSGKLKTVGFINPALYKLVKKGKAVVDDVTAGNDDYTTTNGGDYPATKNYDMATGLGSPIGTTLAKDLG